MKLDMSKAYDRVEWDFLARMIKHLGFHDDWIVLIMRCVCSVSYSVCLNSMHSFSTLLQEAKQKGCMVGAPIGRERFSINHLFFADDCILFSDASVKVPEWFAMVNYDKSLIYFGANVDIDVKEEIIRLLGARVASSPEKYLGLPMMVGRRKTWAFAKFVDRFRKSVEGWSLRYLSMGGKKVFIKSVLQATPIYAMQCFLFSKCLCQKLENIMNKF
ncbi:reverse transcriptase [Gossypium australe]|uniref:Reverse transcriptase n=1 Tax=Gossypium australe TaxID=47621 RepID=A0A5B6V112_9ROSI|nr:reverse transcriptase [Gossypium australe]